MLVEKLKKTFHIKHFAFRPDVHHMVSIDSKIDCDCKVFVMMLSSQAKGNYDLFKNF